MGIWNEVTALAAKSEENDRLARLQGLLADRAAGKHVSDYDLSVANRNLDSARVNVQAHERRREDERDAQRERERMWNDQRQAQRREDDQRAEEYRQELEQEDLRARVHAASVDADAADTRMRMQKILRRMLDGVQTEEEVAAANELLFALSILAPQEAQFFGPPFATAHAWVTQGADLTGELDDHVLASDIDPNAFDNEVDYRATVGAKWAVPLLRAALAPWSEEDSGALALAYPVPPANLQRDHGAPLRLNGRCVFARHDASAQRIDFLTADPRTWIAKPWFSLPVTGKMRLNLPYEGRGSSTFAFSQDGQYLYCENTLYMTLDGAAPKKLVEIGLADLAAPQGDEPFVGVQLRYHASSPVQLVTLADGSVLMVWHVRTREGAHSPFTGMIAIDPLTGTERWRIAANVGDDAMSFGGTPAMVDSWLFNVRHNRFVHLTWRPQLMDQAPLHPFQKKASLFNMFGGKTTTPVSAEPRPIMALHIDERDASTGALMRSLNLFGVVPGCLHHPGADFALFEQDGMATLMESASLKHPTQYGVLDLDRFMFDATRAQPIDLLLNSRGGIGANRVETLLQLYRYFGNGCTDAKGNVSSATRLVRIDSASVAAAMLALQRTPHFTRPHLWQSREVRGLLGPINIELGIQPTRLDMQPLGAFNARQCIVSGTLQAQAKSAYTLPRIAFALFADPGAWDTLAQYEQHVADSVAKATPGASASTACQTDLYGTRGIQRTIGSLVLTAFIQNRVAYLLVVAALPKDFESLRPHMDDVFRHLAGIFPQTVVVAQEQ